MKSMDDLPEIPAENRFAFSADLAEIVWPEIPDGGYTIRFARRRQPEPANETFPLHPDFYAHVQHDERGYFISDGAGNRWEIV